MLFIFLRDFLAEEWVRKFIISKYHFIFIILGFFFIPFIGIGCKKGDLTKSSLSSQNQEDTSSNDSNSNNQENQELPSTRPPSTQDEENIATDHIEITQIAHKKLDIIISIDNSLSMEHHQQKLASRFNDLFTSIQDTDWQIAFINSDDDPELTLEDGYHGVFYDLEDQNGEISVNGDTVQILNPSLEDSYDLQELFSNTINRYDKGARYGYLTNSNGEKIDNVLRRAGSGSEQPLANIINAIEQRNDKNTGFFRQEAALVIIILTNEDETPPPNYTATTAEEVIQSVIENFGASKQFLTYGIIIEPDDETCLRQEQSNQRGGSYSMSIDNLVNDSRTQGITASICEEDYSPILQHIGTHLKSNLSFRQVFLKSETIESSIEMTFTPTENKEDWEFDSQTHQITFNKPPQEGTVVNITYQYRTDSL